MSDFLTNLAVRSAGAAETLRPRLPALFEPPQPAARAFTPPDLDWSEEEPMREAPWRPAWNPLPNDERTPAEPASSRVPREIPREPVSQEEKPVVGQPMAAIPRAQAHAVTPLPDLHIDPAGAQHQHFAPPARPVGAPLLAPPARPESRPEPLNHRLEQKPQRDETALPRPAPSRSELLPPVAPAIPRATKPIIEPRVMPRIESPRPLQTVAPKAKNSEPIIHVTIGRIDVRASAPPTEARKERATESPVMSLEQYLRRRAKRGGE